MTRIRRALLSAHDKSGLVEFARGLAALGAEILSTGGTAKLLRESGLAVRDVSEVTGFPELLDGRVKTLHPVIHGGILARRDAPEHMAALERHGIAPIDLVAVALYPFERTIARPGVARAEAIEQIDVGGPTLIRAAAKNAASVAVVTDPAQYPAVLAELRASGGSLSAATRERLAHDAFRRTAQYDAAIAAYLRDRDALPTRAAAEPDAWPLRLALEADRVQELRYGENPHQSAALYRVRGGPAVGLTALRQLHGPDPSYNNLLDFSAALGLLLEFDEPAAVVVKHASPCGAGLGATVGDALRRAKASDPVSIYGGIVAFVEVLFAPAWEPAALDEVRRTKKKVRAFELPCDRAALGPRLVEYRSVLGGLLAQSADLADLDEAGLAVVSRRPPTDAERVALRFAWRVAKHAKSNAIVLATRDQLIGVGAGQTNRLDSARIAILRARELGLETAGTVCASDAFFPFRDGLDVVARA
ncbi:MAG: bifunctional phosphoribosylaminoimidazolecarboxamide formyltransferase/IMP cyclohydrolase PurH, partial [Candidatus Rokuibacteriota bacterium]